MGQIYKDGQWFGSTNITVDSALSTTSENPVQNKVITNTLSDKADLVSGKVPSSQLPSYVDDVIEGYYNTTDGKFYEESAYTTEITGETGKIYVSLDTNYSYRWSGSAFIQIGGTEYEAGDGINIDNGVVSVDEMPSSDMSEVASPMPSVMSRRFKYNTEEQIVGEWIDGKPLYQKVIEPNFSISSSGIELDLSTYVSNLDLVFIDTSHSFITNKNNIIEPLTFSPPSNIAQYGITYLTTNTQKLRFYIGTSTASENPKLSLLTLQYTKTTD